MRYSVLVSTILLVPVSVSGDDVRIDLLAGGAAAWQPFDKQRWRFEDGVIVADTTRSDGAKTDPDASSFSFQNRPLAAI